MVRLLTIPGGSNRGPDDELTRQCAELLYAPSDTRERLTENVYRGCGSDGIRDLNDAFEKVCASETLRLRLKKLGKSPAEAQDSGPLLADEIDRLKEADEAVQRAIAVDDFDAAEITGRHGARVDTAAELAEAAE